MVLPVRNGGEYLQDAVDSILQQTHTRLELIIVDDHSDDGAVQSLHKLDDRVRLVESKGHGVVNAFNAGLACCEGDFVARMDADDLSLPQRFEAQLAYFEQNPGVDIVSCCVEFFSAQAVQGGLKRYQKWLNSVRSPQQIHRQLFIESPMPNPGAIFRKPALELLGGYRQLAWPEDYDLYLRADAGQMKMGKPDAVLLRWRDHQRRLTHNDEVYSREQFMRAKAYYLVKHRLPEMWLSAPPDTGELAPVIWGAGPTGCQMHDLLVELGCQPCGFIEVHPRRIGKHKRGLPVWSIDKAAEADCPIVLVAVGAAGARRKIADFMAQHDKTEGQDFLFVA